MSLDVYLEIPACVHCGRDVSTVYSRNITHNLGAMADAAGIYEPMWRPAENGATHARHLIERLRAGGAWLAANPDGARLHAPENGWGTYEGLLDFAKEYLEACEAHPDAEVRASR